MSGGPPRTLEWLAERIIKSADRDHILGDLCEGYRSQRIERGLAAAVLWYLREVGAAAMARTIRRRSPRPGRLADGVREVRLAGRALLRHPGYTVTGIAALALALGAAGAVFAVMDGILLRPLPYDGAERVVSFSELHPRRFRELGWSTVPNYLDISAQSSSLESAALFRGRSMSITGGGEARYVYSALVTHRFFETFGAHPVLGRPFLDSETIPGAEPVAILSHAHWRSHFGADSGILGRTLEANGVRHRVVGVMGAGFNAPGEWIDPGMRIDVWIPFPIDPEAQGRSSRSYNMVGRLAPGIGLEDARAEVATIWSRLQASYPDDNGAWELRLASWQSVVVGGAWRPIVLIGAITALVLLVALANASNLILNRVVTRGHEYAVRCALGADWWRLAGQALTEAVIVSLGAALAACLIAGLLIQALHAYPPAGVPRLGEVAADARMFAAILAAGLIAGVVIGIVPAWQAARPDAGGALWRSTRLAGTAHGSRRPRQALAVGQLAMALVLLIGCLLVIRGFGRLLRVDPGFDPTGVMTATVALSWDRVSVPERRDRFVTEVLDRIRALPGVTAAASINSLPLSGSSMQNTIEIPGVATPDPDDPPYAGIRSVSPDYAATLGIPLLGRDFAPADLVRPPSVALVNQTLVRRYLPAAEPIGRRLVLFGGSDTVTIVGVVGDVHHFAMESPAVSEVYLPLTGDNLTSKTFVARTDGDPSSLAQPIRGVIAEVDPDQPVRDLTPMSRWVRSSLAGRRFQALVFGTLATLAVSLSLVGLVAVVSHGVTERLPEIGVRMALGADRRAVLRDVVRYSWVLAAPAAGLGVVGALLAGDRLQALLYEVGPRDPAVFGLAVGGFAVLVTLAALVPALRATRVDPASVLKG